MYYHNPEFTLVRLTPEEQLEAALRVAEKLNLAQGAAAVIVPLKGGSIMDIEGGDFWLPDVNRRCNDALRDSLKPEIGYREVDAHINDASFAETAYETLMKLMKSVISC
jgi:uncharacterized protein (UPF0261 family)